MKLYQCHKRVHAARILSIKPADHGGFVLEIEGGELVPISGAWRWKNMPQVGGYFVCYTDGHTSYSPAGAFEDGYNEVVPHDQQPSTADA